VPTMNTKIGKNSSSISAEIYEGSAETEVNSHKKDEKKNKKINKGKNKKKKKNAKSS
jgi:hypothetical protein